MKLRRKRRDRVHLFLAAKRGNGTHSDLYGKHSLRALEELTANRTQKVSSTDRVEICEKVATNKAKIIKLIKNVLKVLIG